MNTISHSLYIGTSKRNSVLRVVVFVVYVLVVHSTIVVKEGHESSIKVLNMV